MNEKVLYPECEKLSRVQKETRTIHEFLEWLMSQDIELAKYNDSVKRLYPIHTGAETLIAQYFGIDMQEVEKERQDMLAAYQ